MCGGKKASLLHVLFTCASSMASRSVVTVRYAEVGGEREREREEREKGATVLDCEKGICFEE